MQSLNKNPCVGTDVSTPLQKHEAFLKIAPSVFVLASYVNTMALTLERH